MHCIPTTQFLKTKLYNLRQALWQKHGANEAQLDAAEKYLIGRGDADNGERSASSLVQYACSLHGQSPEVLRTKATLFVQFCGVPEQEQDKAATLVVQYMDMFLAVTHPGCE
jgi:hypothetical protein